MNQSRRSLLLALATVPWLAAGDRTARAASYEPVVTGDGLLTQPWFLETFLDMREDLEEAAAGNKRFAVFWEQLGCPYCKEMHTVNFARPEINDYIREHFAVVQLNLWGSREVTDFDGEVLEERHLARKWRVNFTPTVMFFPDTPEGRDGDDGASLEVARMPGYFKPFHFISMFEFVEQELYAEQNFQRYLQDKFERLKAEGVDPNVW